MNVVLDEMRICDDGAIDVRLIPLDPGSPPEVAASLQVGSPAAHRTQRLLGAVARSLDRSGSVKGIVHSGGDEYTVIVEDEYIPVGPDSHPQTLRMIERLADYLHTVVASPVNRNQT